jgi:hypothetical protein
VRMATTHANTTQGSAQDQLRGGRRSKGPWHASPRGGSGVLPQINFKSGTWEWKFTSFVSIKISYFASKSTQSLSKKCNPVGRKMRLSHVSVIQTNRLLPGAHLGHVKNLCANNRSTATR